MIQINDTPKKKRSDLISDQITFQQIEFYQILFNDSNDDDR